MPPLNPNLALMARMRMATVLTIMDMSTNNLAEMSSSSLAQMRLLQLVSPSLPIGAFTYSQGLEWAVEAGWVSSQKSLHEWLSDVLQTGVAYVEIPLFMRLYQAYSQNDFKQAAHWIAVLLANRETAELKLEEHQRGRAFTRLLPELGLALDPALSLQLQSTQLAGFAYATVRWKIDAQQAIAAYVWSWLENLSLAGIKLIPLGQTAGQQIIFSLSDQISAQVALGLTLKDDEMGFSCTALAIASSLHESQYTRLYRS